MSSPPTSVCLIGIGPPPPHTHHQAHGVSTEHAQRSRAWSDGSKSLAPVSPCSTPSHPKIHACRQGSRASVKRAHPNGMQNGRRSPFLRYSSVSPHDSYGASYRGPAAASARQHRSPFEISCECRQLSCEPSSPKPACESLRNDHTKFPTLGCPSAARIGSDRIGSDRMGLLVAARERHSKHRFQLSLLLTLERRRKRRFQLSLLLTVERGRMRLSQLIASRERRCKRRRKCRLQLSLLSAV